MQLYEAGRKIAVHVPFGLKKDGSRIGLPKFGGNLKSLTADDTAPPSVRRTRDRRPGRARGRVAWLEHLGQHRADNYPEREADKHCQPGDAIRLMHLSFVEQIVSPKPPREEASECLRCAPQLPFQAAAGCSRYSPL
jgi:hypothetical protein